MIAPSIYNDIAPKKKKSQVNHLSERGKGAFAKTGTVVDNRVFQTDVSVGHIVIGDYICHILLTIGMPYQ